MDEQYLNMLQYAAAVPAPLRLKSKLTGSDSTEVTFTKPFITIGRHANCDFRVENKAVSSRHLYLQAIGSRIAAIDLHSTSGTTWGSENFCGWLSHNDLIKIPGAELQLVDDFWIADATLKQPTDFRPRDEHRDEYGVLPKVELELLNTTSKGKRWPINRVITLVGRDEHCRITILDKQISRVHCSFLLLPSGLWGIDLTGNSAFEVNGQKANCLMLAEGVEFQIGPYALAARYPDLVMQTPVNLGDGSDGDSDFLTRHNRIFKTKTFGDKIVILPQGDSQEFFYQDIHNEANRVIDLIKQKQIKHVVIDFSESQAVGHILVESLCSFCRAVKGKSALCACTVATYEMLQMTKLFNIWPHYQTRQDAMQAVVLPD